MRTAARGRPPQSRQGGPPACGGSPRLGRPPSVPALVLRLLLSVLLSSSFSHSDSSLPVLLFPVPRVFFLTPESSCCAVARCALSDGGGVAAWVVVSHLFYYCCLCVCQVHEIVRVRHSADVVSVSPGFFVPFPVLVAPR